MTKEQKMMSWHYAKVREEAVDVLSELLEEKIEDTKAGVCNALAIVMHRLSAKDKARAMIAAASWVWGMHEANAHEAEAIDSAESAKPVVVK